MEVIRNVNYLLGTVIATSQDEDDRLEHNKEYHEVLCDVPGVIQGVRCFPMRGELDEPKKGDQILVLDLDPIYHSYMLYKKLKEDDIIGFRASGKMIDITPEEITIGVFSEDEDYEDHDKPKQLLSQVKMDNKGNIEITACGGDGGNIKIDAYGDKGIIINGGSNGEMVNINFLKQLISAINSDLIIAGSGSSLGALMGQLSLLGDSNFKH